MFRQALALDEQLDYHEGMAISYSGLGQIHRTRGDLDEAETMFRKALALVELSNDPVGIAMHYGNLGNIYVARRELGPAEVMHRRALKLHEQLGDRICNRSCLAAVSCSRSASGDRGIAR